jgi:hypothetical protein
MSIQSLIKRKEGEVQPGIPWGFFKLRIPFIHIGWSIPDLIQGGFVTLATAAAAGAIFMRAFGLPFELAWALAITPLIWYYVQIVVFGEPFAPGWITPSIPLVLPFLAAVGPGGVPVIQAMTALALCVAALFLILGVTGLGGKFFEWVPVELRGAIILAAAIGAFNTELARFSSMPYTLAATWIVVFVLMFSVWFGIRKATSKIMYLAASMAMLLGFVAAAIVGSISGEMKFSKDILNLSMFIPPFGDAIKAVSPFYIGWPSFAAIMNAVPLAIVVYIIAFGDLIVANTILGDADAARQDEKIVLNTNRTHLTLFFRNIGQVLTFGPLIPMHGPIWTGVAVFLTERYKEGRKVMDSIYDGMNSWYILAFIWAFITPIVLIMKPLLPIALSITLILTGFACAFIAMRLLETATGRGYALFVALAFVKFGTAWGLAVGIVLYLLLIPQFKKKVPAA